MTGSSGSSEYQGRVRASDTSTSEAEALIFEMFEIMCMVASPQNCNGNRLALCKWAGILMR